jgi:hypothetical protein
VPAEVGRLRRRLEDRDRWFLALIAVALAVAAAVAVPLASNGGAQQTTRTDCVSESRAGVMGYGTFHFCGADARPFCRQYAPGDAKLAADCRRLGFLP